MRAYAILYQFWENTREQTANFHRPCRAWINSRWRCLYLFLICNIFIVVFRREKCINILHLLFDIRSHHQFHPFRLSHFNVFLQTMNSCRDQWEQVNGRVSSSFFWRYSYRKMTQTATTIHTILKSSRHQCFRFTYTPIILFHSNDLFSTLHQLLISSNEINEDWSSFAWKQKRKRKWMNLLANNFWKTVSFVL